MLTSTKRYLIKEGLIKNTYELILKEIQTITTISYVIVVGIGMLFNYQKYSEFRINIFDYTDVFDFLTAPFSGFKILLYSIITIVLVLIVIKFDLIWKSKFPKIYSKIYFRWNKKSWFNIYRYFLFSFLFILYLYRSADIYGKYTMKQIKETPLISLKYSDNQIVKGKVIGKTKDILFLMQNEKVKAIPINSMVKEFEIK